MALFRVSTIGKDMYAPKGDGTLVDAPYHAQRNTGRLGRFERPAGDTPPNEAQLTNATLDRFFDTAVGAAADALGPNAPVAVMVHGFLFTPKESPVAKREDSNNPHCRIFHFEDVAQDQEIRHHTTGWPLRLDFEPDDDGASGLAVAFGWYSQPGFAASLIERFQNFYQRAYDYAHETAWPLVVTLNALAKRVSDRPIDIFCHSLGAAVVVRALALAAKYHLAVLSRIGRVIILGGSEYTLEGNLMYERVRAVAGDMGWQEATGPSFYNIVSRENDVLDKLAENFGPKTFLSNTQVLGHNGLQARTKVARWIDIQIDSGKVRQWGLARNYDIRGDEPGTLWDHWYYYTWRGNMRFYSDLLRRRPATTLDALRAGPAPLPEGVASGFFGD